MKRDTCRRGGTLREGGRGSVGELSGGRVGELSRRSLGHVDWRLHVGVGRVHATHADGLFHRDRIVAVRHCELSLQD